MNTIPVFGTYGSITFFKDDTVDVVRQHLALLLDTHPDRMFVECRTPLPADYYSSNPKNWMDLFFRLSYDGTKILADTLRTYVTEVRIGTPFSPKDITKEEWEDHDETLEPLFHPEVDFDEWRILGVERSTVLPLPPRDIQLSPALIPIPKPQSLYESLHANVTEFRVTVLPENASDLVKRNYYPLFRPDTPGNIESLRESFEREQAHFKKLIELDTPKHEKVAIVKAKWYIPLVSTRIPAPRARFEQIFYGLTVNETTPHIAYFTAKTETLRHKLYVTDSKSKTPFLDTTMLKGWLATTQPQRRKPTLLLYRGKTRTSFDRIAITDKDITVDVRREKDSKQSLEDLQSEMLEWIQTLDAVTPFLVMTDLDANRWELGDLSLVASYPKEIREFDMHRFPCLRSIFGVQEDTFRLLRAEHTSEDIPAREMQAYQILNSEGAERTPEYLASEMEISLEEATQLFGSVTDLATDLNLEKTLKSYPIIKFSNKEVIIKFVTNPERTLKYVDILRFVLTGDSSALNEVCPRRMEEVAPKVAIPQQEISVEEEVDLDLLEALGLEEDVGAAAPGVPPPAPKSRKVKVGSKTMATYNYFNSRLQEFDPNTFDKSIYPSKCDKPKQVIALTAADKARIGPTYNYESAPESEKLDLTDPDGTVICPPYWCMRDEIPLREEQLVTQEDGELHCPVCNGKVRGSDNADPVEFTVIKRDATARFPDFMKTVSGINKRKIPCCYQQPRSTSEVLSSDTENETFIRKEDTKSLGALRMAYLSETLQKQLDIKTHYDKTIKKGRIGSNETDIFRIGLGRPSKTLPVLLGEKVEIKRPSDPSARDNVMKCSFFRTWKDTREGDTQVDRIIASIDEAFDQGTMSVLEEVEYTTSFFKCGVILIGEGEVQCGFWTDAVRPETQTIALIGNDILGEVTRKKQGKAYKSVFQVDLQKPPFKSTTLPILRELHTKACSTNIPQLSDAIDNLRANGKSDYQAILDPFNRVQALFVSKEIILPVQPTSTRPPSIRTRKGYYDIEKSELPKAEDLRAFLAKEGLHPGFRIVEELQDVSGQIVEFRLASGFRAPVYPKAASGTTSPKEVLGTIRKNESNEKDLVDGKPNEKDVEKAQEISYGAEIYEFLMFSLSKDIQTEEYADLRRSIETRSENLYKDLSKWFKEEAYQDTTESPINFINKVRTPCGQFKNKDSCNNSSLCGWKGDTCKIRVKPIVKKENVLNRMTKTLRDNEKQRALVLDERLSPFFSTILYLEMPHELITTNI